MNPCFKVFVLLLISLSSSYGQIRQIQCPRPLLTVTDDGDVVFDPFPSTSNAANDVPVYNPGPIGGWHNLAGSFVDAVRSGSLPYDQIRETLGASGLPCSLFPDGSSCTGGTQDNASFDVTGTIRSFATWWVGLLIVTIIGALLAIGFCIGGMCFCCCRCCGNCGGKRTQKISENMDCMTFSFTISLVLVLVVLFAAVVLAFFANQQTFESVGNANSTINQVVTNATTYVNDTINELEHLVCQLASRDGIASRVIGEAERFNTTLMDFIDGLEEEVDNIGRNITRISPRFNRTIEVLSDVSSTTQTLIMSGNDLLGSVNMIATSIDGIVSDCEALMPGDPRCSQISSARFTTGANFSRLPNVDQQMTDARNATNDVDFDQLVQDGRNTFASIRRSIDESVSSSVAEGMQQVDLFNQSVVDIVNNLTATVDEYTKDSFPIEDCPALFDSFGELQSSVGYIRQCIINQAFDQIQEYDVYRYAFGIVICSLALVTVVMALVGILMGMCGFRKNRDPDQRTTLSHCGGVFLIIGVIITFIFGFVLLILCCIFFFFGANVHKLCQSVQDPEYPLFVEVVDNTSFWGGSLVGRLLPVNPDNPNPREVFISRTLTACRNDAGLFEAANLNLLLPSGNVSKEISSRINLVEIEATLNSALNNATSDFNFNRTSFLPESILTSLEEFRNSSVDQVNITLFREQINTPLLMFDIDEEIANLTRFRENLVPNSPTTDPVIANVDSIIMQLENINNTVIPNINAGVNQLEEEVDDLLDLIPVVMETIDVVNEIEAVIQNITGQTLPTFLENNVVRALDNIFGLVNQSIMHLDEALSSQVARCFPLWSIYTQVYNQVCEDFAGGLNGFWWSLGFCAVLFIPVIVLSVITSNFYLKKKNDEEDPADPGGYSGYDEYPMKNY